MSAVGGREIAVKWASGRVRFPDPDRAILDVLGLVELLVTLVHAAAVAALPAYHRDPFDRMLVAQAACERLTIVSTDRVLADYDMPSLW